MAKRFIKSATYEFGTPKKGSDAQFNPEYRYVAASKPGSYFINTGCRTLEEYLERNPHKLTHQRPLVFLEVHTSGEKTFFGQGTPSAPTPGLNDSTALVPYGQQQNSSSGLPTHFTQQPGQINDGNKMFQATVDFMRERVTFLEIQNADLQREKTELMQKAVDAHNQRLQEVGALQKQLNEILTEKRIETQLKGEYEKDVKDKVAELTKGGGGMGDSMGDIMKILQMVPLIKGLFGGGGSTPAPAVPTNGMAGLDINDPRVKAAMQAFMQPQQPPQNFEKAEVNEV